jgi:2-aminoadipate transaminase
MGFAYSGLFAEGLPAPQPRWTGFPRYNFIGGHNDPVHVPAEELAAVASTALKGGGKTLALYNADGPQGLLALREFVADKLKVRGITASAKDVLITTGSGQGIDLVNRLLLQRGDTVVIEEFTYGGALTKLARLGVNVVGAPLDAEGLEIDGLARVLGGLAKKDVKPKYIYTIPTIQNPTGSVMPLSRRKQLLALSAEHRVPVFEDECYADLLWEGEAPPAIYSLDPSRVIHIGSFSKTLSPALRLGYAVADWEAMGRLVTLKRETDSGTGALDQMLVAEYFAKNFAGHVDELNAVLSEKLATMVEAVEREFGTAAEMWRPKGGIFLWLKLPGSIDVRKLVAPAAKAGIAFNPGPEWACDGEAAKSHMRLCFALPSKEEIREGVAALAQVCFEETGIPERGANLRRGAR